MKKISELYIKHTPPIKENLKTLFAIDKNLDKTKFLYIANSRSGHNFIKDNILSWLGYDNFEDGNFEYRNLENYKISRFINKIDELPIDNYDKSIKILSIRDLLNWYTSYFYLFENLLLNNSMRLVDISDLSTQIIDDNTKTYRLVHFKNDNLKKIYLQKFKSKDEKLITQLRIGLDSWLENAKEFKHETNNLHNFVHIFYDDFFQSKEYRKSICSQLNGKYNESKLNKVTIQGDFSTFDSSSYQDDAQNMTDVLTRFNKWKPEHKKYLDLMLNHEALTFYLDNFDINSNKLNFINKNKN